MKKITVIYIVLLLLTSCNTALKITKSDIPPLKSNTRIQDNLIEFIGFKNSYNDKGSLFFKDYSYFKSFGQLLEASNIATNRSDFYTGVFSFQELGLYKSTKRYISYIDVISHQDLYNDSYANREGCFNAGTIFACLGLLPISIPLWCAYDVNKSYLQLKGEYKLYVFDTQKKEIVYTSPVVVDQIQYFKGQYTNGKTDKTLTTEWSRNAISNAFLDAYNNASIFLNNLN